MVYYGDNKDFSWERNNRSSVQWVRWPAFNKGVVTCSRKRQSYTDQYLSDRQGDVHYHGLTSHWVMCCSVLVRSSAWWLLTTMKPSSVTTFLLLYVSNKIKLYSIKQKRLRSVTYFVVLMLKTRRFTCVMVLSISCCQHVPSR